jgi:hypothetical protein
MSISGALLLYAKSLQSTINPAYWQVDSYSKGENNTTLPLSTLVNKIAKHTKEDINFIEVSPSATTPWKVSLANSNYVNINPYNGDILLTYNFTIVFMALLCLGIGGYYIKTKREKSPFSYGFRLPA